MNYKKFRKIAGVELRLLSEIGMLTQQRIAFKIDNYPNYGISHCDRQSMETYFFADSHPFPCNVSFVIHVDKEGETIIADDELDDYRAEFDLDNGIEGGEKILHRILAENGDIDWSRNRLDDFELCGIQQPLVDNTGKTITFVGGYKAAYSGIQPEGWGIYAVCDVLGLNASVMENQTHLGVLAEGLALMLREDYKIASFMFYCALESFINHQLSSQSDGQRLAEKLKSLVVKTFPDNDMEKNIIYTSTIKEFHELTILRNAIAHGTGGGSISKQETISHLVLVLTLIACIEKNHADFISLNAVLMKHNPSDTFVRFWSSWKDGG